MSIKENWERVKSRAEAAAKDAGRNIIDFNVIAVSKTHDSSVVIEGIDAGIKIFGENYVQELLAKYNELEASGVNQPEWHYIGHLQTNKVKYIAPFIKCIHTVDSFKLAEEISKQALKYSREIDCLIQVNTSGEDSKSGCDPQEATGLAIQIMDLPGIKLIGLMTIGTFSDDEDIILTEFRLLRRLMDDVNQSTGLNLKQLSMGMTHDYELAIREGATYVRVGTAIFGYRDYTA
jgi:pyridoxal phosphate enzyme (YggS family)